MKQIKDIRGVALSIGDSVAFVQPSTREIDFGIVSGFTAQKVRVDYDNGAGAPKTTVLISWRLLKLFDPPTV